MYRTARFIEGKRAYHIYLRYDKFVEETDPDVRTKILEIVPEETRRALQAQWAAREDRIKERRGEKQETLSSEGRPYTQEDLDAYKKAKTQLGLGDWMRSREIASFFYKHGLALPDQEDSEVLSDALDYQDVKLKIVQQEGYDAHDYVPPPAATYISRARARRPGPSWSAFPTHNRSTLLFRLTSLWFFQLLMHGFRPRFRTQVQIPQSRSAEFRTPVPHSTEIPHPFCTLLRIPGGLLGARSVVRTACSREQAQKETPAIPLLSLLYISSTSGA